MRTCWSNLDIKSLDDEQRVITGIASTPETDRDGDIVESEGAKFTLPIPFLWQHGKDPFVGQTPVGHLIAASPTKTGIPVRIQMARSDQPGRLKDILDFAWEAVQKKLVRGLSIGFRPIGETMPIKGTFGVRIPSWEWFELSAVTIPANAGASIQTIKSLDLGVPATGLSADRPRSTLPGASGSLTVVTTTKDPKMKKSYADQIAGFEATRAAKAAKLDAIMDKSAETDTTLDPAQKEEHDTLDREITDIDEHLTRLRAAQEREKKAALPVRGTTPGEGLRARDGATIQLSRELPKGILFARYAMCQGASRGNPGEAMRLAKEFYPDDPGVLKLIEKTAVTGATTVGTHYIADMVPYNVMADFIEFLRPGSIIGKFGGPNPGGGPNYPSLNHVGFNQRVSGMSTGYTAAWRGEGLPALPSAAVTFNTSLLYHNLAALAIMTKEAIRFSNPQAEAKVRDDLAKAVNYKMDLDFVDPAKAAVGTTSPASITNAVVATTPTGVTASKVRVDLATMLALFASNNLDPADIVLIMSASMANQLSMMVNTLGNDDFPTLSMKGGSLRGFPVIVSENLTAVGSPATQTIIAVKAGDVYLADDGVCTVEASDQASIEMVDTSSANAGTGTGASLVSLWQTGAVGLLALREVTWKLRRTTAVQYISPAAYVAA